MAVNYINDLVSHLVSGKKEIVYVSVTPRVGVEMAQLDSTNRTVKKYSYKPLEYNEALKEIVDYQELKIAIRDLFEDLRISPKSSVVLSIPTVHVGKIELPLILSDDMIQEAIISEVEQSYIFKRCEPVISWFDVYTNPEAEKRTILYSAVQKPLVEAVKKTLTSLGAKLEKLEISLTSEIRALAYSGLTETQMAEGTPWTLMVVKSNGYELVQMNGQKMTDYYTEPLALKTYGYEEIYDEIYSSVQIALLSFQANNLVILSETDLVSAEHLRGKMQIEGNITFIEDNQDRKQDYIPADLEILPNIASKISLEIIGTASIYEQSLPSEFEFTGNNKSASPVITPIFINWKGQKYELTEVMMIYAVLAIGAVLIIPSFIALLAFSSLEGSTQSKLDNINIKIEELDGQITGLRENVSDGNFDVKGAIEKIVRSNRSKLIAYSSIGESIPKKLWLKYLGIREDEKIDIVGVSENVEDIYVFYRNLKDSIVDSQLRLSRLEMQSDSIDDAVISSSNYEFEITNLSEEELAARMAANNPSPDNNQNGNDNNQNGNGNNQNGGRSIKDLEEVEVH